jgi:hypothetical protein
MDIYLEIGKKKTFAGSIEWPGWCRSGRDDAFAVQALADYAPRYARVMKGQGIAFEVPADVSGFNVIERLRGTATTDFGAPEIAPASDDRPVNEAELQRQVHILRACWAAFDAAARGATGQELRLGPRGGGRDLDGIIRHALGADLSYLSRINLRAKLDEEADVTAERDRVWRLIHQGLESAVQNGLPESGPRGGKLWTPRYFVRRTAWHELDHAWELEDRIIL